MRKKQEAFLVDYVGIFIIVKLNSIDALMVSIRRKEDGIVNIVIKKFRNKLLHEGHCLGTRCKYVFTYRNHYSPDRLIYSYLKFIISYAFSYFRTKT